MGKGAYKRFEQLLDKSSQLGPSGDYKEMCSKQLNWEDGWIITLAGPYNESSVEKLDQI